MQGMSGSRYWEDHGIKQLQAQDLQHITCSGIVDV